jgi:PTH1 family peptidyl-tRNA hydrolase
MYLIVGLGNPTKKYMPTRHNVGFRVVDKLAADMSLDVTQKKHRALIGKGFIDGKPCLLAKPQTYMNLSGEAIADIMHMHKIAVSDCLIVLDDTALPVGKLRIRKAGSAGGHNGLKNTVELLGTQDIPRLRIGIGSDFPHGAQADYVLGAFSADEEKEITAAVELAAEAARLFVTDGIDAAMARYN